jgi:diguanylate cyclase (GGDEF)-like protein/PAS domain S-box-containing protein
VAAILTPPADPARRAGARRPAAVVPAVPGAVAVLVIGAAAAAGHRIGAASLVTFAAALVGRDVVGRIDEVVSARAAAAEFAERTEQLAARERWFRALVQDAPDVLTVVDIAGIVRYQSPAAGRVLGIDPTAAVGTWFGSLLRPADIPTFDRALADAAQAPGMPVTVEIAIADALGKWYVTETTVRSLLHEDSVRGIVLATRDISARKQHETALTHQAFHDDLTGLGNRALFAERVAEALARADRPGIVGVLYCDLDGFKGVNDRHGHAVGDELLGFVAERLARCVRPSDTVARLGGDEFAILVAGDDAAQAAVWIAERIGDAVGQPYVVDGRELTIGISTGIAMNAEPYESPDALLRAADIAMYKAKGARGGWVRFEPGMRDALVERAAVENDLRDALRRGQLVLYFQPTVELVGGQVVGAEALLRWHHPRRGIVGPEAFIGLAEGAGIMTEIGDWVIAETCRLGAGWQQYAADGQLFHVAVNVSPRQMRSALVDTVARALAESGLPPAALVLELTEGAVVEHAEASQNLLRDLTALGVRLAIDDFGTGHGSLAHLSRLPVDMLKLDRSFVDAVTHGGPRADFARAAMDLGRSLRLVTVAEGVETQRQHDALRALGCRLGQGHLFARAMPPVGLDELLRYRLVTPRTADPDVRAYRPEPAGLPW